MKDIISHLFTPKDIQNRKKHLRRGLYKTRDTNTRYFICRIVRMVKYLINFPPFGAVQRLPGKEILELVEFSIPNEWQKELIIQGFYSTTQGLMEIIEFCERLKAYEKKIGRRVKEITKTKNQSVRWTPPISPSAQIKGSNQAVNP